MNKVIITLVVVVFIHMGYNFFNKDLGDKNLTKESVLICYGDSLTAGYGTNICTTISIPMKQGIKRWERFI